MKYLKVFTDFACDMEPLSFDERGRLFTAMLRYAETGEETPLEGNERYLWPIAKRYIDTQAETYQRLCDRNRKNGLGSQSLPVGASGGQSLPVEATGDKTKTKTKKKEILSYESKERRFVPPTPEEVRAFCSEHAYGVDAERFVNFYESKGWMVGKSKMKDWQAAVRNWAKDAPKRSQYRNEDLERLEVDL